MVFILFPNKKEPYTKLTALTIQNPLEETHHVLKECWTIPSPALLTDRIKILFVPSSSTSRPSMMGDVLGEEWPGPATITASSSIMEISWYAVSSLILPAGKAKVERAKELAKSTSAKISKVEVTMMTGGLRFTSHQILSPTDPYFAILPSFIDFKTIGTALACRWGLKGDVMSRHLIEGVTEDARHDHMREMIHRARKHHSALWRWDYFFASNFFKKTGCTFPPSSLLFRVTAWAPATQCVGQGSCTGGTFWIKSLIEWCSTMPLD